jgi:hypothetical protein
MKNVLNSDFLFLFERLGDVDLDSDFDIICNFMDSSISSTSTSWRSISLRLVCRPLSITDVFLNFISRCDSFSKSCRGHCWWCITTNEKDFQRLKFELLLLDTMLCCLVCFDQLGYICAVFANLFLLIMVWGNIVILNKDMYI